MVCASACMPNGRHGEAKGGVKVLGLPMSMSLPSCRITCSYQYVNEPRLATRRRTFRSAAHCCIDQGLFRNAREANLREFSSGARGITHLPSSRVISCVEMSSIMSLLVSVPPKMSRTNIPLVLRASHAPLKYVLYAQSSPSTRSVVAN